MNKIKNIIAIIRQYFTLPDLLKSSSLDKQVLSTAREMLDVFECKMDAKDYVILPNKSQLLYSLVPYREEWDQDVIKNHVKQWYLNHGKWDTVKIGTHIGLYDKKYFHLELIKKQ